MYICNVMLTLTRHLSSRCCIISRPCIIIIVSGILYSCRISEPLLCIGAQGFYIMMTLLALLPYNPIISVSNSFKQSTAQ